MPGGCGLGEVGESQIHAWPLYLHWTGGGRRDPTEAARWIGRGMIRNVTAAFDRLGALYVKGLGYRQDFHAGWSGFKREARMGTPMHLAFGTLQLGEAARMPAMPCSFHQNATAKRTSRAMVPHRCNSGSSSARGKNTSAKTNKLAARFYALAGLKAYGRRGLQHGILHFEAWVAPQDAAHGIEPSGHWTDAGSVKRLGRFIAIPAMEKFVQADPRRLKRWLVRAAAIGSCRSSWPVRSRTDRF